MPYTQTSVSITSATVPTVIFAPADRVAWTIRVRANAANNILVFAYTGTVPGAAPGGVMELGAAQFLSDNDSIASYQTDAMMQGWAAILETGSTAVAVDAIYR